MHIYNCPLRSAGALKSVALCLMAIAIPIAVVAQVPLPFAQEMTQSLRPVANGLQENAVFNQTALGITSPSNNWSLVPPWLVGKWAHGTQYRIYFRDYKSGRTQAGKVKMYSPESKWLGTNTAEQTFEFAGQQDARGRTWQFSGRPLLRTFSFDPGIKAYNCSISLANQDATGLNKVIQREELETLWVSDKSQKILNLFRDVSIRQFEPMGTNQVQVVEFTRSFDQSGTPVKDEVYQTILSRVDANSHSSSIVCDNIPKPNAVELFKQFVNQTKIK